MDEVWDLFYNNIGWYNNIIMEGDLPNQVAATTGSTMHDVM